LPYIYGYFPNSTDLCDSTYLNKSALNIITASQGAVLDVSPVCGYPPPSPPGAGVFIPVGGPDSGGVRLPDEAGVGVFDGGPITIAGDGVISGVGV